MKRVGYSTKRAFTTGIRVIECETDEIDDGKYCYSGRPGFTSEQHVIGRDFFWSKDEAQQRVSLLARRRIVFLKKSLAIMEQLALTPKWEGQ